MLKTKLISSLEKPFADESFEKYAELCKGSALLGESYSFQLIYTFVNDVENRPWVVYTYKLSGSLANYASVREVKNIGVQKPIGVKYDDNYLRTTPGIYPDVLVPFNNGDKFVSSQNILNSLWIDIVIPDDEKSLVGEQTLTITLIRVSDNTVAGEHTFTLDIINSVLPEQKTNLAVLLYSEGIADYYGVESWTKRYWQIVENALICARRGGVNMALAPIFTTVVGTKTDYGFRFNYRLFDKWIALVERLGFDIIEIPHLFTCGDAAWASRKALYYENGIKKSMAGKRSNDIEYIEFIRAMLKGVIARLRKKGLDHKLMFHIADEPSLKNIETYRSVRASVIDIIGQYPILDAIFDIEYWQEGLVSDPIPITDRITPFLNANVSNLWTYYCTGPQAGGYSNRFIAQTGACHRSLGMQLYKYNIKGFLHWALCYLGGGDAGGIINPYLDQSGNNWVPGGDTGTLYPTPTGDFYESVRHMHIRDAFQDIRAMQLLESYVGHDEVVKAIEEELGCELKFSTCAKSSDTMSRIRERINEMIKERL